MEKEKREKERERALHYLGHVSLHREMAPKCAQTAPLISLFFERSFLRSLHHPSHTPSIDLKRPKSQTLHESTGQDTSLLFALVFVLNKIVFFCIRFARTCEGKKREEGQTY